MATIGGASLLGGAKPADGAAVVWSGSMAEMDGGGMFERDPRNWGAAGWEALDRAGEGWIALRGAGSLIVRTHAAHVVSDGPSAVRFAKTWGERGVRLLYDTASMMTPAMAATGMTGDVLERQVDALRHPELARAVLAVLIADVRFEGERGVPAATGGALDAATLEQAAATCAAMGVAVARLDAAG